MAKKAPARKRRKNAQMSGGHLVGGINRFGDILGTPLIPEWEFKVVELDGIRRVYSSDRKTLLFEKSLEEIARLRKEEQEFAEQVEFYGAFLGSDPDNERIQVETLGIATGENADNTGTV